MKVFVTQRGVRFSDCDPAGIVFFPQYLVMLNGVVEEWFDSDLGIPYANLIAARRSGLPTVRLEVDFSAVSRHSDALQWSIGLERLGRSSMTLVFQVHGGSELRLKGRQVLVCTSLLTHRPQAFPDDLRAALLPYAPPAT